MRDLRHENLVPFIGACVETGHIGSRFVLLLNHLPNFFKRHLLVHIFLWFKRDSFKGLLLPILGSLLWIDHCIARHIFSRIPDPKFKNIYRSCALKSRSKLRAVIGLRAAFGKFLLLENKD